MRTFSSDLITSLAGPAVTGAFLLEITRSDSTVLRFTTHTEDLTYNSNTYTAGVISLGKLTITDAVKADTISFVGLIGDDLDEDDVKRGIYSMAGIVIRLCDYTDTSINTIIFNGRVGPVKIEEGVVKFECFSLRRLFERQITSEYSPCCRATFGDAKCGLNLDTDSDASAQLLRMVCTVGTVTSNTEFVVTNTALGRNPESSTLTPVTQTSTNLGAVAPSGDVKGYFYSSDAWSGMTGSFMSGQKIETSGFTNAANNGTWRIVNTGTVGANSVIYVVGLSQAKSAPVAESTGASATISVDASYTASGYWSHGKIVWYRGENNGYTSDIRVFTRTDADNGTVKLMNKPPYTVRDGDQGFIYAGCDKRRVVCMNKFNNVANFRGEPDLPGIDHVQRYPDREPLEVTYS